MESLYEAFGHDNCKNNLRLDNEFEIKGRRRGWRKWEWIRRTRNASLFRLTKKEEKEIWEKEGERVYNRWGIFPFGHYAIYL